MGQKTQNLAWSLSVFYIVMLQMCWVPGFSDECAMVGPFLQVFTNQ